MDPNSSFTSKNIQLNTFSCSTNLWRLFTEYEPLKVIHGYTTKRPFSGFAGFPICQENGGGARRFLHSKVLQKVLDHIFQKNFKQN